MAEIDIGPLSDHLADDEIAELTKALEAVGAKLPKHVEDGHSATIGTIADEVLHELLDRLDASDAAADIYLPLEFEGPVKVGELRVGSLATLLEVLDELKEDLLIDEEEDEEDDDDDDEYDDLSLIEEQLKTLWRMLHTGAEAALERKLPLYLQGD